MGRAAPGTRAPETKKRRARHKCKKGHPYGTGNTGYRTSAGRRYRYCKQCAAYAKKRRSGRVVHGDADELWKKTLALPKEHPYRLQMLAAKAEYDQWMLTEALNRKGNRRRRTPVTSPKAPNFAGLPYAQTHRPTRPRQSRAG